MFFSDMTLLVVQEQHKDRLHNAQRERLIQEIQRANNQKDPRNIKGWIDALWMKRNLKPARYLEPENMQTI